MPRVKLARVNTKERQPTKLTEKQKRFSEHYAISNDKEEAMRFAGYSWADDQSFYSQVSKLLKHPKIVVYVDEVRARIAAEHGMTRDGVMNRFKSIYLAAVEDRDWPSAVAALREMGKIFGVYEVHQKQKRYSADEIAAVKKRLEENGVSFAEPNKPSGFVEVKQIEPGKGGAT